jgi:hypothetical protein
MMVTWVRGLFKDVHGQMEFDWDNCLEKTGAIEMYLGGVCRVEPAS